MKPLAITGGDCAGIGPEIAARAMAAFPDERFVVYTDRALFARACAAAGVPLPRNAEWREVPAVGDAAAASQVLETRLGLRDYEVLPGGVMRLYAGMEDPGLVTRVLVEAGVSLTAVESKGANLEDYFLNLIGGVRHA